MWPRCNATHPTGGGELGEAKESSKCFEIALCHTFSAGFSARGDALASDLGGGADWRRALNDRLLRGA